MHRINRVFISWLAATLVWGAATGVPSPTVKGSAANRMKQDVAALSVPSMQGRGDGSKGLERAAAFVLHRYKALGLKAEKQTFPFLTDIEVEEGKAFLGKGDSQLPTLQWGKDIEALSFSGDAEFNSKALAFVGYGIQSQDYNDFSGIDLTSHVIAMARILPDIPAFASLSPVERSLRGRLRKLENARIGGIILLEEGDTARPLKLDSELPTFPFPVVSMTVKALSQVCGDLKGKLKAIQETGKPQSQDFVWAPWSYMGLHLELKRNEADLPNLIATIPGSDPNLKTEVIILGAHLDHLGRGERHGMGGEASKGRLHPGADDNASGTAMLLELARELKVAPPRRSILLVHFSGEEEGLLGSAYWINHPTVPLSTVKAMVNFDMVGRLDPKHPTILLGGLGAPKAALDHAKTFAPKGIAIGSDLGTATGSSDHLSFALADIPTFFFFTGLHPDYHRPSDTAEKINGPGMAQVAQFAKQVALDLANADRSPDFDPTTAKLPAGHGVGGLKVSFGTIPDYAEHQDGFHINGVSKGSSAEAVGLKTGDVITEFAGKSIKTIYDYMDALSAQKAGDSVKVKWLHGGKTMAGEAVLKVRE